MAQSRLLVAALLGLQAGAGADDASAPTAIVPDETTAPTATVPTVSATFSPTITLSPTAFTPPNNEDDNLDWTDDVGRCTHRAENAVLFPFCFLALGALTMYLTSRYAPDVPYTVIMLCEGFLVDWWASLSNSCPLNAMQDSLYQWSHIDGNLLLLVFLPALLFGDSMSMNTYQFFRAKWQCLLLAGPGVVFAALLTAVFARWAMPYNWSFSLAMTQGAILASTDPVAIVAVLKSAGASETLTVQITGESLLNDGASMILFSLFFRIYRGKTATIRFIVTFFAKQLLASPAIGVLAGIICLVALGLATRRFGEEDPTIQLMMTICTAYLSYFMANLIQGSGVLAVVVAGIVVAARSWPLVVAPESVTHTWAAIEHIGNTLIFALAGVITRRASFGEHVHARDFGYSVVFYLLVNAARAGMVFGVYPILRSIGYGMGKREAVFVVWGGLHGAVGLALAMNVQATLNSDRRTGDLVLFHVAAVSFLSMIINGTTARYVLQALGLVKTPGARLKLRARVREAIEAKAADAYQKGRIAAERDLDDDATQHVTALRRAREKDESRAGGDPSVEPTPGFDVVEAEAFVESFRGEPVEDDEVSMLRETFYRILKVEYRAMVETGELPRHSLAALHLERAANRGLDNTHKPIHDYKLLRKSIGGTRLDKTTDAFFKRLDACLGARCTLDNRLHYALAYERHETAYHVSRAIVAAHRRAQFQLAEFYGNARRAGEAPETAAEAQVVLESARQCAAVERNVERIPPGLAKIVDTDVVAHHVLDVQVAAVWKYTSELGTPSSFRVDGVGRLKI